MVKLIVDSGSTKTDWCFAMPSGALVSVKTGGINPAVQDAEIIEATIKNHLLPSLPTQDIDPNEVGEIYYYGAGCTPDRQPVMRKLLTEAFRCAQTVEVCSDLLAAARALCLRKKGIACILGTGANSCLYDGEGIVAQTPALGYILGDEGSGAVLGRLLVGDVLKHQLPEEICSDFFATYSLTPDEVVRRVYREPMPNRFLASFAPFLHRHRSHPAVHALLLHEFRRFFLRNVAAYERPDLPIGLVGSIAFFFQEEIGEAAAGCSMTIGKVLRAPL